MIFLVDTTTPFIVLGLSKDGEHFLTKIINTNGKHTDVLIKEVKHFFNEHKITPFEIEKIYVGRGPGKYTGIRIGVTFAKVLAYSTKAKLYSFSSLNLVITGGFKENVLALSPAKTGAFYTKRFFIEKDQFIVKTSEDLEEEQKLKNDKVYEKQQIDENFKIINPKFLEIIEEKDLFNFAPNYLKKGFNLDE